MLADRGINVIIHFNRADAEAPQLAAELQQKGVNAWTIQSDFRRPDEYQTLIQQAQQMAGGLDILINNASIFPAETLPDLSWPGLSANMEVNAWVPFVLSRTFAQQIGHGKIVNLHDSRLKGYDWTYAGYILSKHVLTAMTQMMALEFAPHITVNLKSETTVPVVVDGCAALSRQDSSCHRPAKMRITFKILFTPSRCSGMAGHTISLPRLRF
jgi:NAD(P)-dependent dehydrogenase (short-subunit alcohol dehydrogenase family)